MQLSQATTRKAQDPSKGKPKGLTCWPSGSDSSLGSSPGWGVVKNFHILSSKMFTFHVETRIHLEMILM